MGEPIHLGLFLKTLFIKMAIWLPMDDLSSSDKMILLQHAISKYEDENILIEKLKAVLQQKDIDRGIAALIATQQVRRIGPDILQNNVSHIGELPELPPNLRPIIESL